MCTWYYQVGPIAMCGNKAAYEARLSTYMLCGIEATRHAINWSAKVLPLFPVHFFAKSVEIILSRFQYWDGIFSAQARKACILHVLLCEKHNNVYNR